MFGTFMEAQNVPVLKILMVMKILFIFIFIFTLYKGKYKELILHVKNKSTKFIISNVNPWHEKKF